ncbi:MAG: hypothetical protein OXF88_12355 [Rhodobacteraceae bacterium]|nr:hypothetical protein [Paracoccaceae bacterium]
MSVAVSRQKPESRRRVESRFSNFVLGDARPSTYCYVFVLKDETDDMQERDGAIHRSVRETVPSGEESRLAQRLRTYVAATRHGAKTRDRHDASRLFSDWVAGAVGREPDDTEVVYRSMLNDCLKLPAPPSATEIPGGNYARDLAEIVQRYARSVSYSDNWAQIIGSIDSVRGRDHERVLWELQSHLNQLFDWYRGVRIEWETSVVNPTALADLVVRTHEDSDHWLDSFAEQLFKRLPGVGLKRVLGVWNLEGQEAADGFGVSEETLKIWLRRGVPADVAEPLADLSAATDLLLRYLKADRIPAVVRKPAEWQGGKSLVDMYSERDMAGILEACRDMFRFEDMHA